MPQFPMTESRRKILERIPDYAVAISPAAARVRVSYQGQLIADSAAALLVEETRHAPVYYLPRADVTMQRFERTDLSTYCPFKGHASYWRMGDLENFVWSYEDPYPEVEDLKDYLSFYTDKVTVET